MFSMMHWFSYLQMVLRMTDRKQEHAFSNYITTWGGMWAVGPCAQVGLATCGEPCTDGRAACCSICVRPRSSLVSLPETC